MLFLATLLSYVALTFVIVNSRQIRTPQQSSHISSSVSVILPMRNEEENVDQLLASLAAQKDLSNVEFLILDDNSTDTTSILAKKWVAEDSRFTLVEGEQVPDGWIGKTWALQQLFEKSRGEILVSIDADVRLSPHAIASSISAMKGLSFFSAYPAQTTSTFTERLIQPLLQWSWLSSVPLRFAERSSNSSFAVANGQFFIVNRSALEKINGYERVKSQVLDDIELARELIKSGARGTAGNGSEIASCHMYSSWSEIKSGYGKSLWKAFGGNLGTAIAIALIALTGIIPFLFALTGSLFGLLGYGAIVLSRVISAQMTGGKILDSFLHPLSAALLIYLIIYSRQNHRQIQWKGRAL